MGKHFLHPMRNNYWPNNWAGNYRFLIYIIGDRGLPVPTAPAQKQFDQYHHLTQLIQQGWTIQYLNYISVNHIDVPNKLFLNNPELNVKIIITQWQI